MITDLSELEPSDRIAIEDGDGFRIKRGLEGFFYQECCACGYRHAVTIRWSEGGHVELTWSAEADPGPGADVMSAAVRLVDRIEEPRTLEELELQNAVEEYRETR